MSVVLMPAVSTLIYYLHTSLKSDKNKTMNLWLYFCISLCVSALCCYACTELFNYINTSKLLNLEYVTSHVISSVIYISSSLGISLKIEPVYGLFLDKACLTGNNAYKQPEAKHVFTNHLKCEDDSDVGTSKDQTKKLVDQEFTAVGESSTISPQDTNLFTDWCKKIFLRNCGLEQVPEGFTVPESLTKLAKEQNEVAVTISRASLHHGTPFVKDLNKQAKDSYFDDGPKYPNRNKLKITIKYYFDRDMWRQLKDTNKAMPEQTVIRKELLSVSGHEYLENLIQEHDKMYNVESSRDMKTALHILSIKNYNRVPGGKLGLDKD